MEKSGRPPGSVIIKNDQYMYPFSDLQFNGGKAQPKDSYRLIISASDGTTSTRSSYELEIHCSFDLKQYPFDSHYCPIDVYTARHPSRRLSLSWYYSDGARLNASAGPAGMHTSLAPSEICNFEEVYAVTELNAASDYRQRQSVIYSYKIFCTEMMEGVCDVETMLWNNDVPSTAYLTAADIWVFLCNVFIFLSLLEAVAVHILMKMSLKQLLLANKDERIRAESRYRHEKQAARRGHSSSPRSPPTVNGRIFEIKHIDHDFLGSTSTSNYEALINDYFHRWSDYYSVTAARIDLSARIIIPTAYCIAATLYFSFYLFL
ncbi:unnamed protein product [Thelazia callipaeda]|uniref:Neur_chan_LBD domain-containing protein n=1 Tax=Thelazia callipaeda TaxID=103827 RepID=A0A0N5CUM6_THECL|nr:unnamed protein product [Thelazia callipaeda]